MYIFVKLIYELFDLCLFIPDAFINEEMKIQDVVLIDVAITDN